MEEKFSYFLDNINNGLLNKKNNPFVFLDIILDYLNNFNIIKKGLYLRSFSNSLFLYKSNIENIPLKLSPLNELKNFTENICSNVLLLKKNSFNLYLLGENISNLNSIIVTDKIIEDIDFLKSILVFLQLFYKLRIEKTKNLKYKNIFLLDKEKYFIKSDNDKKKREINIIQENDFIKKNIFKLENKYIIKNEPIYFLDNENDKSNIHLNLKNTENMIETLNLIKKYSNNLEKELGLDSVYHTEISTILRLSKKILENF